MVNPLAVDSDPSFFALRPRTYRPAALCLEPVWNPFYVLNHEFMALHLLDEKRAAVSEGGPSGTIPHETSSVSGRWFKGQNKGAVGRTRIASPSQETI